MYVRQDRQLRNGRYVTYLSLAHNVKVDSPKGKRTKPIVFANLGNEDNVSFDVASGMVDALTRYVEKRWGKKPQPAEWGEIAKEVKPLAANFRLLCSKEFGMRLLLSSAWRELGIGEAISSFEARHKCEFPVERLVFAMVLNRLVDPKSKLACNEWVKDHGFVPEAKSWQVQHFYRTLDVLHEHWQELEDALARALWERLTVDERQSLLVDTTTLYFEARANDAELAELDAEWDAFETVPEAAEPRRPRPQVVNEPPFRMQGHNKDGHPGDPQVVIASVCTPGGFVLRHACYPGNTSDFSVARDLIANLPRLDEDEERVWVSDGGMLGKEMMAELDGAGWKRLSAEGPRKSKVGQALLADQMGRYRHHPTKDDFSYREFDVAAEDSPSGLPEKWVVTRNERDRERQLRKIEQHVERTKETLAKQRESAAMHPKSVCGVVAHQSLKRYVKPSEKVAGTYVLDQDAIRKAKQLAGVRFYRSTKLDWDGVAMWNGYQMLQQVEANHREYKGPLLLQPCYHRSERRIEAHVMLTILAVNCVRHLERRTGKRMNELRELFSHLKAVELADARRTCWQRTDLNPEQEEVLKALDIPLPALQWTQWIDSPMTKKRRR